MLVRSDYPGYPLTEVDGDGRAIDPILITDERLAGAADDEPIPDTARSGPATAIVSLWRWYKKAALKTLRQKLECQKKP